MNKVNLCSVHQVPEAGCSNCNVEINYRICKKCNIEILRIHSGRYPNGKDIKWTNAKGHEWSGKTCPDCHRENSRVAVKARRSQKILM